MCGADAHWVTELATVFSGEENSMFSGILKYRIREYCDQICYFRRREDGPCWSETSLIFGLIMLLLNLRQKPIHNAAIFTCMSDRPKSQLKLTYCCSAFVPPPSHNHPAHYPSPGQSRLKIHYEHLDTPLILTYSLPTLFTCIHGPQLPFSELY